jgi:D-alanyl-D-alanine carboxypeptidase
MKIAHSGRRHRAAILSIAVVLAVATASCGSDKSSSDAEPTTQQVPDIVQSDDPNAAKIVEIVRNSMKDLDLTSAVFGVWQGDKEIVTGALGGSPVGVPATRDMQLRIGQPMEPMLSRVLLQLNESGTLNADDPIAKWVPDFPRADKITPRMLANGTSGISDYVTDPEFLKQFYANPIKGFTAEELFKLANSRPPLFEPGTSWAYAHSDLVLLGVVLEKASGKSLGDLLAEHILQPLGMDASKVQVTPQMVEPILHGYTNERGVFEDSTFWNPTAFLNSGNMNTTVADVAKWITAMAGGKEVSAAVAEELMAPKTAGLGPLTKDKYFAYGLFHLGSWLIMNPAYGGYHGIALYEEKTKTMIIAYVTLGPTSNANVDNAIPIGTQVGNLLLPDNKPNIP